MPSNRNRSRQCWLSCPALRRAASCLSARDRAPVPCQGRCAPESSGKNGGRGHQGKPRPEMSTGMTSMERLNAGPRQLRPSPGPDKTGGITGVNASYDSRRKIYLFTQLPPLARREAGQVQICLKNRCDNRRLAICLIAPISGEAARLNKSQGAIIQSVYDCEKRFKSAIGTVSDCNFEIARLDYEAVLVVPETKMLRRECKFDAPLFARSQRDALKPFQFLHRTRDAGGDVTQVKLRHFVSRAFAGV